MAFNLHKLARAAEFSFDLSSIGLVRCKPLSSDLMSQAWKRIKTSDFESRELTRWLLGEMAKRPTVENFQEADPIEGNSLTTEQLIAVTNQELESFSERLVQKNLYLVRAHEGEELKRVEGQSACDFLAHAIEHRCTEEKAQIDRIIQSTTRPLFVDSTLESIKKSVAASNKFEDLIKKYSGESQLEQLKKSLAGPYQLDELRKQFLTDASAAELLGSPSRLEPQILSMPPMHFPKNPILETNQILENLTIQIEGMRPLVAQGAEMIRGMNDTALRMQADYIANAVRADRQTNKAMWVAGLSLIVSAIGLVVSSYFSYQSYADSKSSGEKENAQIKVFKESINTLVTEQRAEQAAFLKQIGDANRSVPKAKK